MSEAREIQERFDELAARFLRPLLAGGPVVVGQPVSPGMLDHFTHARPSDGEVDRDIVEALELAAADVAPVRALPFPERGLAATFMACHDLLAVTDPALDRVFARSSRETIVEWVDFFVEHAGAPRTRGEALSRHAVVSRMLGLRRHDVTVKNWAYTYRFFGRPVPKRVVALPRLRMVREQATDRNVLELWADLDDALGLERRLRTLVSRSPVTELLHTGTFSDLRFGVATLAVLSDDLLRNGIARLLVAQGDAAAEPIGRAIAALVASRPPERLVYYALALAFEMHVIAVLDAREGDALPYAKPGSDDARLFAAVLPAMLGAPDDLSALLDLDPRDLERLRRRGAALDRAAGESAARAVVSWIDLARAPRLDHERDPASSRSEKILT